MLRLGLLVNPFAGIGGSVALKGSDGEQIRTQALAKGAVQMAMQRARIALEAIGSEYHTQISVLTASGDMGESVAKQVGLKTQVILDVIRPSQSQDTHNLVRALQKEKVDLILFAGGDGTARDVLNALDDTIPVLGIPAGVKIHSGVYAVTPKAAGLLLHQFLSGELLSLREASVMDIDEQAFRQGQVKAMTYGTLCVPDSLEYVQATKKGGVEVDELVLDDIADHVIELMESDDMFIIGSGSTCAAIMTHLNLDNTLLGVDVIQNRQLIASDVNEKELLALTKKHRSVYCVITLIGGQGHLLGRGNQQLSRKVIESIGWDHVYVIATKTKLKALEGRPLIVDSGDIVFDEQLSGTKSIITGYHDTVWYRVG